MFRHTKIAFAATVLGAVIASAYAAKTVDTDTAAINLAKISMAQAVTAAEQQVNGKATRAEYERTTSGLVYAVEVASGSKLFDVQVDAEKGTVISTKEGTEKQDDEQDHQD